MNITVWIVSTCVPGEAEPCQLCVFATEAEANAYADNMLRNEWDENGPEDDETGERKPYPGDWREAQTGIVEWLRGIHVFGSVGDHTDDEWGEWQITSHEVEIGGIDYKALARRLSDALLNVRPLGGSEMFAKVGDEFYADPEYCAELLQGHRDTERETKLELIGLRRKIAELDGASPRGRLSIGQPGVDRMTLDAVAAEALEIVQEGDSFGERADHPTTIRTRQLLERLAREAVNG